jgi:hypothetical protein
MKPYEFNEVINRWKEVFGENKFPKERVDGFWTLYNKLEFSIFKRASQYWLESETRAPTPQTFRKYVDKSENINNLIVEDKNAGTDRLEGFGFVENAPCEDCGGLGYVIMVNENMRAPFACYCKNGKAQHDYATYHFKRKLILWQKDGIGKKPTHLCPPISWADKNGFTLEKITKGIGNGRYSPWPARIEAIMRMIEMNLTERGFKYALSYNAISEEDAWYLYEQYKNKNFEDAKSLNIFNRVKIK